MEPFKLVVEGGLKYNTIKTEGNCAGLNSKVNNKSCQTNAYLSLANSFYPRQIFQLSISENICHLNNIILVVRIYLSEN